MSHHDYATTHALICEGPHAFEAGALFCHSLPTGFVIWLLCYVIGGNCAYHVPKQNRLDTPHIGFCMLHAVHLGLRLLHGVPDMPSEPHLEGQTLILNIQPSFSCSNFVLALTE